MTVELHAAHIMPLIGLRNTDLFVTKHKRSHLEGVGELGEPVSRSPVPFALRRAQSGASAAGVESPTAEVARPSGMHTAAVSHRCAGVFAVIHHAGQFFRTSLMPVTYSKNMLQFDTVSWAHTAAPVLLDAAMDSALNVPATAAGVGVGTSASGVGGASTAASGGGVGGGNSGAAVGAAVGTGAGPALSSAAQAGDTSRPCAAFPLLRPSTANLPSGKTWQTASGCAVALPLLSYTQPVEVSLFELRKITTRKPADLACCPVGSTPRVTADGDVEEVSYLPVLFSTKKLPLFQRAADAMANAGAFPHPFTLSSSRRNFPSVEAPWTQNTDNSTSDDDDGRATFAPTQSWIDMDTPWSDRPIGWIARREDRIKHHSAVAVQMTMRCKLDLPPTRSNSFSGAPPSGPDGAAAMTPSIFAEVDDDLASHIVPASLSTADMLEAVAMRRADKLLDRGVRVVVDSARVLLWSDDGTHLAVASVDAPLKFSASASVLRALSRLRFRWR